MKKFFAITMIMLFVLVSIPVFGAQASLADANAQAKTVSTINRQASLERFVELWIDVPAADADWFLTTADFVEGETDTFTNTYNIYPRNVTLTITDPNYADDPVVAADCMDAFTVKVTGVTHRGLTTETFTLDDDWESGTAVSGEVAYLYLTSIVIEDCNNLNGDETFTVGTGQIMGLTKPLLTEADILNVSEISGSAEHLTVTADAVNDTIDPGTTAPNGSRDFLVLYITRED